MENVVWQAVSRFGKLIRLTEETWTNKILKEHPEFGLRLEYVKELQLTIESPEYIVEGWQGEHLALRWCEIAPHARPKIFMHCISRV